MTIRLAPLFALVAGCVIPAQPMGTPGAAVPTVAAAPAAAPAAGGATVDLAYTAPDGWSVHHTAQGDLVQAAGGEAAYTILILPSEPLQGSIDATFRSLWDVMVTPNAAMSFQPAPFRRRLRSGYALALDGGIAPNSVTSIILYTLVAGDRVVPILGIYKMPDWSSLRAQLETFFDGMSLPGTPPDGRPLYDASEVAGHWSTHSTSIASYVTASGQYAGDASIATADTLDLDADGSFKSHFVGYNAGSTMQADDQGTWSVQDDSIVLTGRDRSDTRRIYALGIRDGAAAIALGYVGSPDLDSPRGDYNMEWYGR